MLCKVEMAELVLFICPVNEDNWLFAVDKLVCSEDICELSVDSRLFKDKICELAVSNCPDNEDIFDSSVNSWVWSVEMFVFVVVNFPAVSMPKIVPAIARPAITNIKIILIIFIMRIKWPF